METAINKTQDVRNPQLVIIAAFFGCIGLLCIILHISPVMILEKLREFASHHYFLAGFIFLIISLVCLKFYFSKDENNTWYKKGIKELKSNLPAFVKATQSDAGTTGMNTPRNSNNSEVSSYSFKLINGTFDFDDAREILITAYHAKINFHKLKAWSKSERGEIGVDLHTARALELEIEIDRIRELLHVKASKGMRINITCAVNMKFESEE